MLITFFCLLVTNVISLYNKCKKMKIKKQILFEINNLSDRRAIAKLAGCEESTIYMSLRRGGNSLNKIQYVKAICKVKKLKESEILETEKLALA